MDRLQDRFLTGLGYNQLLTGYNRLGMGRFINYCVFNLVKMKRAASSTNPSLNRA